MFWDGSQWTDDRPVRSSTTPAIEHPRRLRDWLATLPIILLVPILIVPMMAVGASSASLSASGTAVAGGQLNVSGQGFPGRDWIQLSWDGSPAGMPTIRTSSQGALIATITIPAGTTVGSHTLAALGQSGSGKGNKNALPSSASPLASVTVSVTAGTSVTPAPTTAPTSTPTPAATPTPTPAATPTPTPAATPTPTPAATPTPTPTPTPSSTGDTIPPVITNVSATSITSTGAQISWSLNEPATGRTDYGLTTAYGLSSVPETTFKFTSHVQVISGLQPNTTYHYRVRSSDAAGNTAISANRTFTTLGVSSPSPTPTPTASPTPTPTPSATPAPTPSATRPSLTTGGTINATGFTYTGPITLSRPTNLIGATINAPAGQPGIIVTSDNVTIDRVTVIGTGGRVYHGSEAGITTRGAAGTIRGLVIRNSHLAKLGYGGMWLQHVENALVEANTVEDVVYTGIMFLSAKGGTIANNDVRRVGVYGASANSNNAYGIGISNQSPGDPISTDVMVRDNLVEDVPTWHAYDTHGGARISFVRNTAKRSRHGIFITGGSGVGGNGRSIDVVTDGNLIYAPAGADQYAIVYVYSTGGTVTRNQTFGWKAGHGLLTVSSRDLVAAPQGLIERK